MSSNDELAIVDRQAKDLVDKREPVYKDNWQKCPIEYLLSEIDQKSMRIKNMDDCEYKYEQALDLINYARFVAWRIRKNLDSDEFLEEVTDRI